MNQGSGRIKRLLPENLHPLPRRGVFAHQMSEVSIKLEHEIRRWQQAAPGISLSAATMMELGPVFAASDYLATQCLRSPQRLADLDRSGRLRTAARGQEIAELVDAAIADLEVDGDGNSPGSLEAQQQILRELRHRELIRIAWRDLAGLADTTETLGDTSDLAEALIASAVSLAQRDLRARYGDVPDGEGNAQRLLVVAMGKLGGRELNFSSDVDLVFLFPESGDSNGARTLDAQRYFTRVGQRLIELLQAPTSDGFVYRVDTRLRPFGSSGPLAMSFAAFESYLLQHGREWERYAYIKARAITGHAQHRRQFSEMVRPFVYRRYLDFGVLESLRDMKQLIARDVARRERRDDLKLGPGGIREVEFVVQSLQLLRGGADPQLRSPGLLTVLPLLAEKTWLSNEAAQELECAYLLLRRAENHLQMWQDQQVHLLPQDAEGRERLAFSLGFDDWTALEAQLHSTRATVASQFKEQLFPTQAPPPGEQSEDAETTLAKMAWTNDNGDDDGLAQLGYSNPAGIGRQLRELRASSQYRNLDRRGRRRLDSLVPRMLTLAAAARNPDEIMLRLLHIIVAVGRRSAYFALLTENPAALRRLAKLVGESPWIARRVAESPILLDELIDPRVFEQAPTLDEFAEDLQRRFAAVDNDDLERQMEALRLFKHAAVFRVAVADLSGVLPLMKVSDRLTDIAELVLSQVISLARREMRRRYGRPVSGDGPARFGIVGYGKLGGLELGYASDLDVVFLHDADTDQLTDGPRPLDNGRYFTRLGQRILHMLNTTTVAGVLYEVDIRLRPSGKGGPLVSSVAAFGRYQHESAWTWEHQALLRARIVAGDQSMIEIFDQLRAQVLTQQRDLATLTRDIVDMRERMRREIPGAVAGRFDIKNDPGGLTDIEFIVQYLVLAHASAHPGLVRYSDNIRQLEALAHAAIIDPATAGELSRIYRGFRQKLHRLALADVDGEVADSEFEPERAWVRSLWQKVFRL